MTSKRDRVAYLLVGELLASVKHKQDPAEPAAELLDVLCAEYEEKIGEPMDGEQLSRLMEGNRDLSDWIALTLAILRDYHPQLGHARQLAAADFEKFMLVYDVENLFAVGYSKHLACKLLEASGRYPSGAYRRYCSFKEVGGWFADKTADIKTARHHVTDVLHLPLPPKGRSRH